MPEDIHEHLWLRISEIVIAGKFAVTTEIYDELCHLPGLIGACLQKHCAELRLEVGEADWDWKQYIAHVENMRATYRSVISEYNSNRKGTVGFNDISIVALAKTLALPVLSMEKRSFQTSATKMRIPQVCECENVTHMDFNQFLRAEGITI